MNKQKWLIVGLSLAMAASIGVGISACGDKDPDTPEHTHEYTKWEHSETQHWMVCPDDGEIWAQGKQAHDFTNGKCECGMKEADVTPDEGRDTRVFYVVGSGAGDLSKCSFTELKSDFKLTKQPKKDENGYTVYTTSILTLYAGDTMKIVQDLDWDEGLGYFGVSNIKNNDGSLVDGGGPGNITPAVGKDGKYRFTVRTKPDIAFAQCTLEFEFVEPVEPLKNTEEIYIVGLLQYCDTNWPDGGKPTGCQKLDYDEETGEWSITLRLGGYMEGTTLYNTDEFKLFNAVNGAYIPDGTNNNKLVSGTTDRTDPTSNKFYKAAGDYKISWKKGDVDVTFTKLEHTHVFDRTVSDADQHWTACWLDDTEKEGTRENHVYDDEQDATCDTCGYKRHIHKYTQQMYDETEHWMECPTDHAIDPEHPKTAHTVDPETHLCECGYEQHTHEYTKWEHDAKQHWKVCPKDNEADPETPKAPHSFDPDTHTCECGYEHTHEYTKYNYNNEEHWKECPTDDVIDESTRTTHTFDQAGDKCVCGMGKPDCDHSKGYAFEYEELPECNAEGGTLDKFCPDCRSKQTVTYVKGIPHVGATSKRSQTEITEDGNYYLTGETAFKFHISKAGTYTVRFEGGILKDQDSVCLYMLAFMKGSYLSIVGSSNAAIYSGMSRNKYDEQIAAYGVTIDGYQSGVTTTQFKSLSIVIEEDDLTEGDVYVQIGFNGADTFANATNLGYLISVSGFAAAPAAASVAPVEVAMLPEKKD